MIEFDIWLTADDQLVIIHGGDDGQMPNPIYNKDQNVNSVILPKEKYIFEQTFSDL